LFAFFKPNRKSNACFLPCKPRDDRGALEEEKDGLKAVTKDVARILGVSEDCITIGQEIVADGGVYHF
jgi:hypothetical protein